MMFRASWDSAMCPSGAFGPERLSESEDFSNFAAGFWFNF